MLDTTTLAAIASSTVAVIVPLLQRAIDKGAEEIGQSVVGGLLAKLKARLTRSETKDALDDLAKSPTDTAAQGALSMQLRKSLAADPELVQFLHQWMGESKTSVGISQSANVHGNHSTVTQIVR